MLDLLEDLIIAIPVGVFAVVTFVTWLYPKLEQMGYWRFIETWVAFWLAEGVLALILGSVTIGIGLVTALEYFLVAQVVSLVLATVVFRLRARRASPKPS